MRRHEIGVRTGLERDLQQVAGIEPEDRPSIGRDIADAGEPRRDAIDRLEIGRVDEVMDFAGAVGLLVDGRDLDLEHEAHRRAAGGRQRLRDRLLDLVAQPVEAGLRRHELLLELGAPGRMGEVAGRDHADALAACPGGEVFEVEIPARRARIFRVDVQIRVEAHAGRAFFAAGTHQRGVRENRRAIRARFARRRKAPLWTSSCVVRRLHARWARLPKIAPRPRCRQGGRLRGWAAATN